jgi:hypothetical protein
VFIGILDPNQGVCGKGVLELQSRRIAVELYPPDLAMQIRAQNDRFVRAQQTLGARIIRPAPNSVIESDQPTGQYQLLCECINSPGQDVFVLTYRNGEWWPQPHSLRRIEESDRWETPVFFGMYGEQAVHIVKASELGAGLIAYYRKVTRTNTERLQQFRHKLGEEWWTREEEFLRQLPGSYPGIELPKLPKGLDSQASVTVNIVPPGRR